MGNIKRWFIGATLLFLAILFCIVVVSSIYTGRSIDECFFGACCGCLYGLGLILGLSYKEICVIVNIYLESALCLLSVLWVTWISIRRYMRTRTVGRLCPNGRRNRLWRCWNSSVHLDMQPLLYAHE